MVAPMAGVTIHASLPYRALLGRKQGLLAVRRLFQDERGLGVFK